MKYTFKLKHLLSVLILIIIIVTSIFVSNQIKLKKMLDSDMHFEAWQLVYSKPYLFKFSDKAKDERIQFFNVMATHSSEYDKASFSDNWALPDFTGWSCAEIACALKNINQKYEVRFIEDDTVQHNLVVKHKPAVGKLVNKDEAIILYANSAFCSPTGIAMYKYMDLPVIECGEWVYFAGNRMDSTIYRAHIDFSDIEPIYDLDNENYPYLSILIAQEDYVYFFEEYPDDRTALIKISSDGKDIESLILKEGVKHRIYPINIYNKILYTPQFSYNLSNGEINEYDIDYGWRFLKFKGQTYFYEVDFNEGVGDRTSKVYIADSPEKFSDRNLLLEIDGRIVSMKIDRQNLYIAYETQNFKDKIIAYDLNNSTTHTLLWDNKERILTKPSGYIMTSYYVFRDEIYVVGQGVYDYKYDINTLEKTKITISDLGDSTFDAGSFSIVLGNYLMDPLDFKTIGKCYNLITNEFLQIDSLPNLNKEN